MEDSSPSPPGPERSVKRQKLLTADLKVPSSIVSGRILTLTNCYVTEVLAFPCSLAVFRQGFFSWNATCWLDQFAIPELALRKIADHCKSKNLDARQICEFRGSSASIKPSVRLLVVFPQMKSFRNKEVQKIWTDNIVLPSISCHVDSSVRQYLPSSYEFLRNNSQVERVELGRDVGDTASCFEFQSNRLQEIWADIVRTTLHDGYEEFRGVFLVALGQWHPTATFNKSVEGAWKSLTSQWDWEIDTNYIPVDTLEVRMESQFSLGG